MKQYSDESGQPVKLPVLRVAGMSFAYPKRHLFAQWSHEFGAGLTWVRGHNGDGKSTLLKLLAGALTPHLGGIALPGSAGLPDLDVVRDPLAYRRKVFWCGPGAVPFDHLSPAEYFGFMRNLYPDFDDAELARHVTAFMLHPHLAAPLDTLSTGTQRKVWISAALAAGTPATLLDEPVNALDADSLAHLMSVLDQRAQDPARACIVVSHEHLGKAADRAMVLDLSVPQQRG